MKLKATTKVQHNARATLTTIPSIFVNAMEIKKGNLLDWTLKSSENELVINIKLVKTELKKEESDQK
jgi:hypothetical protein